jgi:prepilin-type N-terminal cleavage/methylation domain-containing protein
MMAKRNGGFTIVELLIVIVVIAILAAITITAFNGIQQRTRDSKRVSDMNSIKKSLELYKLQNGRYPLVSYSGLGSQGGWETSAMESPGQFLAELANFGFSSGTPVDPVNDGTDSSTSLARSQNHYGYYYYRYAAGNAGCDPALGAYYILGFINAESNNGGNVAQGSPGFSCSGRNWGNEFDWVTGGFEG